MSKLINPTNERKTRGDLVHQIVTVLVKNNAQVTPDTTWVHDFTELITTHTNAEIANIKLEEVQKVPTDSIEEVRKYKAERIAYIQSKRAKLKEVK